MRVGPTLATLRMSTMLKGILTGNLQGLDYLQGRIVVGMLRTTSVSGYLMSGFFGNMTVVIAFTVQIRYTS